VVDDPLDAGHDVGHSVDTRRRHDCGDDQFGIQGDPDDDRSSDGFSGQHGKGG
jgi:hypothetical protein